MKRSMKKSLSFLVLALSVFGLAGCGADSGSDGFSIIPASYTSSDSTSYTVTTNVYGTTGGTITTDKKSGKAGETVNVTVTVYDNYEISDIEVNNNKITVSTSFSFTAVAGENTVNVTFDYKSLGSYTTTVNYDNTMAEITTSNDSGSLTINSRVRLYITTNIGYYLDTLVINGTNFDPTNTIVYFVPVNGENVVNATFKADEDYTEGSSTYYRVDTRYENLWGTITLNGATRGNITDDLTLSGIITANDGYSLQGLRLRYTDASSGTTTSDQLEYASDGSFSFTPKAGINIIIANIAK